MLRRRKDANFSVDSALCLEHKSRDVVTSQLDASQFLYRKVKLTVRDEKSRI